MPVLPDIASPPARSAHLVTRLAPAGPRLAVRWTTRRENFRSSLHAYFAGPRPPREFLGTPYFRDCWVEPRWPLFAFVVAIALETMFVMTFHPRWNFMRPPSGGPDVQLTWYQPPDDAPSDLPSLSPAAPALKTVREKVQPAAAAQPESDPGADAYNARQRIWSRPLAPNHPRQELLEPAAPPTPPKILPALPNIVQWNDDDSANPALHLAPAQLQKMQPARAANKSTDNVAAPDITNQQQPDGPINIALSADDEPKPAMVVPAMSRASSPARSGPASAAAPAPEIGPSTNGDGGKVIALSETPGPAAPPAIPQGNLQARISMSPDGRKGGPSGASGDDAGSRAGNGPPGIGISGAGNLPDAPVAAISGPSGAGNRARSASEADPRPEAHSPGAPAAKTEPAREASAKVALAPGAPPESLLGANRVYTLHMSMPNLSSASGSWTLSFAELDAPENIPNGRPQSADSGLAAPVPMRKVDPKYPPELQVEKVQGEVVLYAVIRKDGTVDSIQLVQGVDPQLDENAMEALGRWKFEPASRHGEPVDIVAVVHIPFYPTPPEPIY